MMVTDTAFYRYAPYHTAHDTPEKLNYPAMAQVVEGVQHAIAALASDGKAIGARPVADRAT